MMAVVPPRIPSLRTPPIGFAHRGARAHAVENTLEAFADRGYDGMSVRELNRQLGASHNLVHHYFGSKEALWRAAIDYGLGRAAGIFQAERWPDLEFRATREH